MAARGKCEVPFSWMAMKPDMCINTDERAVLVKELCAMVYL